MRVEIKKRGQELNSFQELVEKAVNAEAKAALRPCFYTCKIDQHCLQGSWAFAAITSTQRQLIKDQKIEEPKSRPQELKTPAP